MCEEFQRVQRDAEYASSSFIQFHPSSGQDVDGLVARPRPMKSELGRRGMQKQYVTYIIVFSNFA